MAGSEEFLGRGDYSGEFVDGGSEFVLEVADAVVRWCWVSYMEVGRRRWRRVVAGRCCVHVFSNGVGGTWEHGTTYKSVGRTVTINGQPSMI